MEIVRVVVEKLNPAEYNPRQMTEKQAKDLEQSIKKFGLVDPIIVNKHKGRENVVIGGHQRLKIAQRLGFKDVPVVYLDLPEKDERELNLSLNKNMGEWDWSLLANFEEELLKDVGFDSKELDKMLKGEEDDFDTDEALENIKEPESKLGAVYDLGRHRLMCGDATNKENVEFLMDGKKADMVFTDPPYGVSYQSNLSVAEAKTLHRRTDGLEVANDGLGEEGTREMVRDCLLVAPLKTGGVFYVCSPSGNTETYFRLAIQDAGYTLKQCIVWNKSHFVMGRQDYQWKHESILYGWLEGNAHQFYGGRTESTVWDINRPSRSKEHPTMKPIELITKAIKNSSKSEDIVLDLFGGSGSTLIAAEQTGRICYMMEIDPKYCDVIRQRYERYIGTKHE